MEKYSTSQCSVPSFVAESFESRLFLSGNFTTITAKSTLIVTGTSGNDEIHVNINGTSVVAILNGNSETHELSVVKRVRVEGLDGDDLISVVGSLRSTLLGGDGNDSLTAGDLASSLEGDAGDDSLVGGAGDDTLAGGSGNNLYDYSGRTAPFEFVFGSATGIGPGNQQLTAINGSETDLILSSNGNAGEGEDTVAGTDLADRFLQFGLTPIVSITLEGRGGSDVFDLNLSGPTFSAFGGGGNDRFFVGEDVTASVFGGAGDDQVQFHGAIDADGGPGRDTISYAPGDGAPSTIDFSKYSSFETDQVMLNSAAVSMRQVIGTAGPNRIELIGDQTTGAPVSVYGGDGNDTLVGSNGADVLFGGNGDDVLAGGRGDDTLRGEAGNDTLDGGPGRDHLFGHDGSDLLFAADGERDTLDGGAGTDSATVDKGPAIFDVLIGIESS